MTVRMITQSPRVVGAIQMIGDIVICHLCFVFAMALRLETIVFVSSGKTWIVLAVLALSTVLIFFWLGLYRSPIRLVAHQAIRTVALGAALSSAVLLSAAQIFSARIPYSVPIIYAVLLFLSAAGIRFLMRSIFYNSVLLHAQPVAIFDSGDTGRQLREVLSRSQEYLPLAFIDDAPGLQGTEIGGLGVYAPNQIRHLLDALPIKTVILAVPTASRARRREIVSTLEPLGLEIKTIPNTSDVRADSIVDYSVGRVMPEDLFGPTIAPPREELMRQQITGKVVLVSGAGGRIGSELCRQIINYDPAKLILLDILEDPLDRILSELRQILAQDGRRTRIEPVLGSVQEPGLVGAIFRSHKPETIYHAAAYKDVALVEANVVEGIRNNAFGTKVIAEAASSFGGKNFVLISSDEATHPCNFMAASQRLAELICQALAGYASQTVFSVVRMGNVLASSGSMISHIHDQIDRGGPVTIKHPEFKQFFMPASEAAQLVVQGGAISQGGEVFIIDMGEPISALELAETMIKLRGLQPLTDATASRHGARQGQIAIQILGLDNGEKIHPTPMFGKDPEGTMHPRILKTAEPFLSYRELQLVVKRLERACNWYDLAEIREILMDAPISYTPTDDAVHDAISYRQPSITPPARFPKLKIVKQDD